MGDRFESYLIRQLSHGAKNPYKVSLSNKWSTGKKPDKLLMNVYALLSVKSNLKKRTGKHFKNYCNLFI
jgi:hypothetical protein